MEEADLITRRRLEIWRTYHQWFESLEKQGSIRRPVTPKNCGHNAHMYYLILPSLQARTNFIDRLKKQDIHPVFHYIPLDSAPMGHRFGRTFGKLSHTHDLSERLVRLPLWIGIEERQAFVVQQILKALG